MSAILSADDLNDFISPGVACIKPVETLPPSQPKQDLSNPYEVTTEEAVAKATKDAAPAQISLTDCLACSGCVTSAEAVLIGLQSHEEVLNTLAQYRSINLEEAQAGVDGKVFVASVSPQTRATLAAAYGVSEKQAGSMIEQLLCGPQGLGKAGRGFLWVLDTNSMRKVCLEASVQELKDVVEASLPSKDSGSASTSGLPKKPILSSSCPGWICYAEKTHPHILPHLSRLKSPQALTGTMVKSVLSKKLGIAPDRIWHLAIMPCFDKKLEASREELTDAYWRAEQREKRGVRDVDCVITAKELLMLAELRGVRVSELPKRAPSRSDFFPDSQLDAFLFPPETRVSRHQSRDAGSSGGYAYRLLQQAQSQAPETTIRVERGRNPDIVEYSLVRNNETIMRTARYYGFRNITNLVRKLKPAKQSRLPGGRRAATGTTPTTSGLSEYDYIEVMACPGGCTNGGGQIKVGDMAEIRGGEAGKKAGVSEQKEWLARVDEAYYSADSSDAEDSDAMEVEDLKGLETQGLNGTRMAIQRWCSITQLEPEQLLYTTYRKVESDVGKASKVSDQERVAGLASSIGGGW